MPQMKYGGISRQGTGFQPAALFNLGSELEARASVALVSLRREFMTFQHNIRTFLYLGAHFA